MSVNKILVNNNDSNYTHSIFDISEYTGNSYSTLSDALNDIPQAKRKGGMTIRYVQTNDNKYVQYRCITDEFSSNVEDWATCSEQVTIFNLDFIYVETTVDNKILWGIKTDGNFYFGAGCPPQVKEYVKEKKEEILATIELQLENKVDKVEGKELSSNDYTDEDKEIVNTQEIIDNPNYMCVEVDAGNKILGGRKIDGTKFENTTFELPAVIQDSSDNPYWIEAKTDKNDNIIEGLDKDGNKYLKGFTKETKDAIVGFTTNNNKVIKIRSLDEDFISPVPVTVSGTKGNKDASYVFDLPLGDVFNIRFKFRVVDNLLNQNASVVLSSPYVIGRIDRAVVDVKTRCLYQYTEDVEVDGQTKTMYFPTLNGGLLYKQNSHTNFFDPYFAFYVKYVGEENTASIENNGTAFILKSGNDTFTYTLSNYDSVYELYAALKTNTLFDVEYKELVGHTCDELAIFPECTLISTYYAKSTIDVYEDSRAPFFVPYSIDNKWHQVEIVKIGDYIYTSVDGASYIKEVYSGINKLHLGGECGVYFKDIEIGLNTPLDAEISDDIIVSSVSPCLIVFEGHGMIDKPADEFSGDRLSEEGMATSTDRLYYVFKTMIQKGYVPVTMDDVTAYYNREKYIPKRSFTVIFDDFRYENCLNLAFRKVFVELGIKPALAIIYNRNTDIIFGGSVISKKEASEICLRNNFQLLNHTDHTVILNVNPSQLINKFENDIIQADKILVDGMIFVYPGGNANLYTYNTLKWIGAKLGVSIAGSRRHNPLYNNRYFIRRVEIGSRATLDDVMNSIY